MSAATACSVCFREDEIGAVCGHCGNHFCQDHVPEHPAINLYNDDDYVTVCSKQCEDAYISAVAKENADAADKDGTSGRVILVGTISGTRDWESLDYNFELYDVEQLGQPFGFRSSDFKNPEQDYARIEIIPNLRQLAGCRVELSCRIVPRHEQRCTPHGNSYGVTTDFISKPKVLRVLSWYEQEAK